MESVKNKLVQYHFPTSVWKFISKFSCLVHWNIILTHEFGLLLYNSFVIMLATGLPLQLHFLMVLSQKLTLQFSTPSLICCWNFLSETCLEDRLINGLVHMEQIVLAFNIIQSQVF